MKNNRKQLALRLALCVLAAVVVWVFVDNYGPDGSGPVTYTKWFRDVPISYTSETVLTDRGLMLLDEGTTQTVDLEIEGSHWDLAMLDSDYLRVTVDLAGVTRTGSQTAPLRDLRLHLPLLQQERQRGIPDAIGRHHQRGGALSQDGGRPLRDHRQCCGGLLRR